MSAPRSHSLRARLLAFLFGAVALAAVAQAVVAYVTALAQADVIFDRQMQKTAMALQSSVPLARAGAASAANADRSTEDFVVQMWAADGTPVFQSAAHQALRHPATPGFSYIVSLDERTYRVYLLSTPMQEIQIAQDMAARRDMATTLALRTTAPILLTVPLLLVIVWWVVSRSLAPLTSVRSQMALRRADELSPLSEDQLPEEIRPMIRELNLLFDRLRQAFNGQKVFVADAAHEMRSPLAALKIQLQGLQRAPDDPARELAVRRLAAGIDRATHLVEQLLVLARQEATGAASRNFARIDLSQAAFLSVSDILLLAQSKQIDLGVHRAEPVEIDGNAEAIRILVRNLLDNAVKYTPAAGTVDLEVRVTADGAQISVEDSGPGIAEADRGRVMDRFYRASSAGATGSGLGLAIVHAISTLHDATVHLDDSVRLGGLRVRVLFKRATAA